MRKTSPFINVISLCTVLFTCLLSFSALGQQQFDVALTKTTITNSAVKYGTPVPFNITIYNQGLDTIMNVLVLDHFGDGYEFQSSLNPTWDEHLTILNAVHTTYTEKIPPNQSRIITVNLIARAGDSREDWINTAEVVDFTDRFGISQEAADLDSFGDENPDNDAGGLIGSAADNEINGNGTGGINDGVAATDEDDHDRDTIQIFDLALTKVLDPITGYNYGDTLTFTTTVFNQGNIRTRLVRIRDIVPEGYINPVSVNEALGWSSSAANPVFTFDVIEPFSEVSVELKLVLDPNQTDGDAWVNYAEIIGARFDNNGAIGGSIGNSLDADSQMASNYDGERAVSQGDSEDNQILNTPISATTNPDQNVDQDDHDPAEPEVFDLALIKERATALSSFNYGNSIDYTFTVVNQGNMAATDIVLVDSLPCGAMFDQALNPNWTFDAVSRIATTTIAGPLEPLVQGNTGHQIIDTLVLIVIGCLEDQETAWTNYMEISQATNMHGVQTVEIDGVFDSNFHNDAGGVPLSDSDNALDGIGFADEDNHDVELLQVYDLALKKELITEGPFIEGQDIDFRIRVYNQGNIVIEDLIVEDFIPEGFGFNLADNTGFGWTTSYTTNVGGIPTIFPDTLNVMNDLFLATEDSVDIMIRLQLELDGTDISDWYNYAHIWVATDTVGNSRFDDADSNPFMTSSLEFAVIPNSPNDNNIFSEGKTAVPIVEDDDHDVANVSFFDLSLTKTATSNPTAYGQQVTFDILVKNEGVQFAHDITVVDYLPCGLTFDAGNNTDWVANAITGNPEFFYTDTLYAGEEVTIPISLTISECMMPTNDSYRNEVEILNALNDDDITGDDQDSTPDNNDPSEDDQDDAFVTVFDLSLEKLISTPPTSFVLGSPVVYDIVVTNEGNTAALNTVITDYIPCGLDFTGADNIGWTQNGAGNLEFTITTLINPGMSVSVPLTLTIGTCIGEPFDLNNIVEITDDADPDDTDIDDFDSTPDNNDPDEDDIDDESFAFFDLSLAKTLTSSTVSLNYGQDLNYQIIVTNEGSIEATSFTVTDYLSCGLGFTPNNGWILDNMTGNISRTVNTPLIPGQSVTLDLTLTLEECAIPTVDSWNNVAEISEANDPDGPANDEDSTPDNNDPDEDDQDDAPLEVGDLALDKNHIDPTSPIGVGTDIDYTISVTNQGNVVMTNVTITDYLPCGLVYNGGSAGWSTNSNGDLEFIIASLTIGETVDIPLVLTVDTCLPQTISNYINIVEVSDQGSNPDDPDSTPDDNPTNDPPEEDDHDDDPLEWYDLSLMKSSNAGQDIKYEDVISYTISVLNEGSLTASNVVVTDYIPCGLRFDATQNTGWSFDEVTGYVSSIFTGDIVPGDVYDFTLNLIVEPCVGNQATAWNNVAEITGGDDPSGNPGDDEDSIPDDNPTNDPPNEDDIDDDPIDVFDLSLTKTVTSTQAIYELGQDVSYNIEVTNEGNIPGNTVVIIDYIPCGMTLSAANSLPWNIGTDGYARLTVAGAINVNQSINLEIILTIGQCAQETGSRVNLAEISNTNDDVDADSVPDEIPDNDPEDEDDNDDVEVDINVGSTIGDFVFNDLDGDGIQDNNEQGIGGVIVTLFNEDNEVVAVFVTGSDGLYEFEEIDAGNYYVTFMLDDEDLIPSPSNAGNGANDSNVTEENGPGSTPFFEVISGQDDLTIDAGFFICSLIKGVTYYDVNEDDIRQSTENGINGLVVNLYKKVNGQNVLWDSETTHHDYDTPSDDGIWDFCVSPGQYYIEVEMPPIGLVRVRPFVGGTNFDSDINNSNGLNTTPTFTLFPGGAKTDLGAGYYPMATVGNRVWMDENANGIQETNEAKVEGVVVQVYNMDHEMIDQAITNSEGVYTIEYLMKEEYYLKFEAPEGFGFTFANATGDDLDSDVNHAMGINTTSPRFFNPGDVIKNVDAGIVNGVLPVVWTDIKVVKEEKHNILTWTTAHELNVENYIVERRLESEDIFIEIGTTEAAGNSNVEQSYNFIDEDVINEDKYYYRVRQIDFDGKYSYSNIVVTERLGNGEYKMYPNPTNSHVNIEGEFELNKSYIITIIDDLGREVIKNTYSSERRIDLRQLSNGIYTLLIKSNDDVIFQERIIKL